MSISNFAGQSPGSQPSIHVDEANARLKDWHPQAIVEWALGKAKNPMLSTNFRPLAAGLLHMVTRANPETPVVWVDTGYNTTATYEFAERLLSDLELNLRVFTPRMTVARRRAIANGIPDFDDPALTQEGIHFPDPKGFYKKFPPEANSQKRIVSLPFLSSFSFPSLLFSYLQ